MIEVVAGAPGRRILNSVDPDAPNGLEISRVMARHLGHERAEVLLDGSADPGLGRHPWDRRPPVVLDMTAAADLGYRPVGDYAATVAAELDWLARAAAYDADGARLPAGLDAEFFASMFDYPAEDQFLAATRE